jgi:anti-sigma factor RsiW
VNIVSDQDHTDHLGPYVLGILDPDEVGAVEGHLAGCPACREQFTALVAVRDRFASAPAELVLAELADDRPRSVGPPAVDDLVLARTLREIRGLAGPRRGRALQGAAGIVAAAAAAAILAGGLGVIVGRTTAPAPTAAPTPATASQPAGRVVQYTDPETHIAATVTLTPAKGWTRLAVTLIGAPVGATCRLVAVAKDGRREPAGSWVVAAPAPGAPPTINSVAAIADTDLATLELAAGTGKHWVTVAV